MSTMMPPSAKRELLGPAVAASEGAVEQIRPVGEMFAEERGDAQFQIDAIDSPITSDAGTTTWLFPTEQET
jgi:hypothetical protein